nr:unnamed protein product [Callosobruchus chinensis]
MSEGNKQKNRKAIGRDIIVKAEGTLLHFRLPPKDIGDILKRAITSLKKLPNINIASTGLSKQITICGDLHGKFDDLLVILHKNGLPSAENPYIFNGDFVDRGKRGLEVFLILLLCFIAIPGAVYLNRGNHEDIIMNQRYLPLGTIVNNKVLIVHGGISDSTDLEMIRSLDRGKFIGGPTKNANDFGKLDQYCARSAPENAKSEPAAESGFCRYRATLYKFVERFGGLQFEFRSRGLSHPMNFLKKLERLLNEAGVPEGGKLILALGCLRGSAAEWAEIKEDSFRSFVDFVEAFKNRYWGVDEQRSLFYEIKYGKFESGSRADYFLKLARLAKFLSEKINEEDLIAYISQHFSNEPEIRKSIVTQNLDTLEQVEIFLRKLDVLDSSETNNRGRGRNWDRGGERSNERGICVEMSGTEIG